LGVSTHADDSRGCRPTVEGQSWSNERVTVRVSIQASPRDRASWLRFAAEVAAGFDGLFVADHPGSAPAPFVALAAAAGVTEWIRLGTCVLNAGTWDPVKLASETATLDVVSGGRAVLGVGAGHTPAEWTATGQLYPSPAERVGRMIELVTATEALLAGEPVSCRGEYFTLIDATLRDPRPVQDRIPLLIGGNGTKVLHFAAQHADIVGVTGAGRTLADGHRHDVDWSAAGLRRIADIISVASTSAGRRPQIDALVQHVEITDDAHAAAQRLTKHVPGASVDDLLGAPFVWLGTVDEIRDKLRDHEDLLGIERYMVRGPAVADVRRILNDTI
jgi:probable F420-dependent oxidoreductase